ncbi:MAG: ATP synthase subunit I [Deltaproteobacteria bacterium]|nr:ATP synthase subunit I [Candidatus Tharpellaceae bacterium]HDJ28842.1 ATP synthase subunit I [Pseudomonadota bacterium]
MVFVHSGIFDLPMAFAAGLLIGSFYFLALWLTVRRLPKARFPAVLTLSSYLIRSAVSMGAFYLVMAGCWERLLVSLLGFIVMRFILVRRFQPQKPFIPAGRTC